MKSVNEVSKLSGVSRRTLQYYDEIGLLPPSAVKWSGYRQYDDESLRRLWSILFYKELGLSLDDIRLLLENPEEMEKELLRQHKQVLLEKQAHLQKLLLSVDRVLNDEFDISMLRDFDKNKINVFMKKYSNEIRAVMDSGFYLPLIKSGILSGNVSFEKRTAMEGGFFFPSVLSGKLSSSLYLVKNASKLMNMDFVDLGVRCGEIVQKFRKAMKDGSESTAAKEAVVYYKDFLSIWIPCDDNTFRKIGQSYFEYKEELDKKTPGLAEFVSASIGHIYP